jgi:hypothetical protein
VFLALGTQRQAYAAPARYVEVASLASTSVPLGDYWSRRCNSVVTAKRCCQHHEHDGVKCQIELATARLPVDRCTYPFLAQANLDHSKSYYCCYLTNLATMPMTRWLCSMQKRRRIHHNLHYGGYAQCRQTGEECYRSCGSCHCVVPQEYILEVMCLILEKLE